MEQFYGCWMTYPKCKEDCYWYEEWQDMGAHIPYCRGKKSDSIEPKDCENCEQYHSKYKPTNADSIRSMTDEELAVWIAETSHCSDWCKLSDECEKKQEFECCINVWLNWLRQEK